MKIYRPKYVNSEHIVNDFLRFFFTSAEVGVKSLIADGWTNSRGWSGDLVFSVGQSLIIFELTFELLLELLLVRALDSGKSI